jgi:hypothetical protein
MVRALGVLLLSVIGIVLGAELLLRVITVQPKLDCPKSGTVLVVAGLHSADAELLQGCVDGDRFHPSAKLRGRSLVIHVPKDAFGALDASPRVKVIAVHHGDVGAGILLRGLDAITPLRRLRPWDYPDRDVQPIELGTPSFEADRHGGSVTIPLDGQELDRDSHVTVIADAPKDES